MTHRWLNSSPTKSRQELPSPIAGVVTITEKEGADLPIGAVIGSIDSDAARPAATADDTAAAIPATRVEVATETAASADTEVPRATPMARHLAKDRGVELSGIHGTGPSGRVTKSDVLATSSPSEQETN